MSSAPDTKRDGPLSMREFEPQARARTADELREERERRALSLGDGRKRRAIGRSEPISLKTFPHIKKMILDMADAENKSFTEIIEDAVQKRHMQMKGERA